MADGPDCGDCGTPVAGGAAVVFTRWAEQGKGDRMEESHGHTAGKILDALAVEPGARFLDLGTGNGWAPRRAAARGARAVGVDVAPGMLARARALGGGVDYVLASFEALPFRDGAFGGAFSTEALYYADDLEASLREASRVLGPGAALDAVVDYYLENPDSHSWPELTGLPLHLLAERAWAQAFERAGLRDAGTARVRSPKGDPWQATHGSLHVRARK